MDPQIFSNLSNIQAGLLFLLVGTVIILLFIRSRRRDKQKPHVYELSHVIPDIRATGGKPSAPLPNRFNPFQKYVVIKQSKPRSGVKRFPDLPEPPTPGDHHRMRIRDGGGESQAGTPQPQQPNHTTSAGVDRDTGWNFAVKAEPIKVRYDNLTRGQRRAVQRQAEVNFRNARGYAHLQILRSAESRISQEIQRVEREIHHLNIRSQTLERQHSEELRQVLELHLLKKQFEDVSGIGASLKQRILRETGARRLNDLLGAHSVAGVGPQRMQAIETWVYQMQAQIPSLLATNFPGRNAIDQKYRVEKDKLHHELWRAQQQLYRLQHRRDELHPHLSWLGDVSSQTFVDAATGSPDADKIARRYSIGLFPAWEPVPPWFAELVKETNG